MRLVLFAVAVAAAGPALAAPYTFTPLPAGFTATALNNLGQVAGQVLTSNPVPGGPTYPTPSVYDRGTVTPIGPLLPSLTPPLVSSYRVSGINDAGDVAGVHSYARFNDPIILRNGAFVSTAAPSFNVTQSQPTLTGLNSQGQVIGFNSQEFNPQGSNSYLVEKAFVSSGSAFVVINTPDNESAIPYAINNHGQVVGTLSVVGQSRSDGFLYVAGEVTTVDVPGAASTVLNGINDAGEMSGTYTDAAGVQHGFTETGGVFSDVLGPDGSVFLGGHVNNAGQLVGTFAGGGLSYLATPVGAASVPEPASAALLGSFAALGAAVQTATSSRKRRMQP